MQTFVVRLWTSPGEIDDRDEALRGVVEHLGTGTSQPFRDDEELLAFLHGHPWLQERELQVGRGDGGAP